MLDCRIESKTRYCYYKGVEMTASQLVALDECVISLPTLTQRISQGINNSERSGWDSIEKCLTTVAVKGCPKRNKHIKKPNNCNLLEDSYFLKVMMMMPVNNSKPRIVQSKPL